MQERWGRWKRWGGGNERLSMIYNSPSLAPMLPRIVFTRPSPTSLPPVPSLPALPEGMHGHHSPDRDKS